MVGTREKVLQQSYEASGQATSYWVTSRGGKKNGYQKGQADDGQKADPHRNEDLDQDRNQRYEDNHRPAEFVDRRLLTICQASTKMHGVAAHSCGGAPAEGVDGDGSGAADGASDAEFVRSAGGAVSGFSLASASCD